MTEIESIFTLMETIADGDKWRLIANFFGTLSDFDPKNKKYSDFREGEFWLYQPGYKNIIIKEFPDTKSYWIMEYDSFGMALLYIDGEENILFQMEGSYEEEPFSFNDNVLIWGDREINLVELLEKIKILISDIKSGDFQIYCNS